MVGCVACQGTDDDGDDGDGQVPDGEPTVTETGTPTDTDTGDTDTGTPPGVDVASCANSMNPLVFDCSATLATAGPATLVLSAPGLPTRTFESPEVEVDHAILGWGIEPDTAYTWELAGQTGTLTTGSLGPGLADLDVTVTGTLFGIDAVVVYVDCGWFVMLDGEGDVIWAVPTFAYDSFSDGMMWAQADRTVIAVRDSTMSADASVVVETDLLGLEVLHLEPGADFDLELTHDVGRWGAYTYLLGEDDDQIGGFEVWEGTNQLGTWLLSDAFAGVQALDTAHVNGLTVSATGEVVISVHGFDAVVAVDGDPASATFLQMAWHASGSPGGPDDLPNPDYLPSNGEAFFQQHNASRTGDDLWVFDNRSQPDSRAVRMVMDHVDGTLTETGSWSTGESCFNQGGATPIAGGALVTCANSARVFAFQEGSTVPDWTLHADCGGNDRFGVSTRAFPVIVE